MRALWAAITIIGASGVDVIEMDIMTLQHDTARAQRHIKEQLDGLNRAERNIAQLVEDGRSPRRGETAPRLETEVRELRALLGTRPEPGVLYELSPGAREDCRRPRPAATQPEAQIATRAAAPADSWRASTPSTLAFARRRTPSSPRTRASTRYRPCANVYWPSRKERGGIRRGQKGGK